MYICYLDESGHVGEKPDPEEPAEVVCGVVTDPTKLTKSQREHRRTLDDLGVPELKAAETYRGQRDWAGVHWDKRDAVFGQVLSWAQERHCKFILAPIDCGKFFSRVDASCGIASKLRYPWEAGVLNVLLALQRHHQSKPANKGRTLVICDEQKGHSTRLLDLLETDLAFTDGFTGYKSPKKGLPHRLDQIIDVPHFSRSHLSVLIQIADWAAYTVRTHLRLSAYKRPEAYDGEGSKFAHWFAQLSAASVPPGRTCPPGKDPLCVFYREQIRPPAWPPISAGRAVPPLSPA